MDIDAYACCIAMKELLTIKGKKAVALVSAPLNYSVCNFLIEPGQYVDSIPCSVHESETEYVIVDVSDPNYIKKNAPVDRICTIIDHHTGFEKYWSNRIGDQAKIEYIGAAATLVYREWEKSGLQENMSSSTALLMIAAILDNTLNLESSNTTVEDIDVFKKLCVKANVGAEWCENYFLQVQENIEANIEEALLNDIKMIEGNLLLPKHFAQLCVWDAKKVLKKTDKIFGLLNKRSESCMLNIIDIKQHCSYFLCGNFENRDVLEKIFRTSFINSIAKCDEPYLRKEIIKKVSNIDKRM